MPLTTNSSLASALPDLTYYGSSLILHFLFVSVGMISPHIRFKAISLRSTAFIPLLWVANPLRDYNGIESKFHKPLILLIDYVESSFW